MNKFIQALKRRNARADAQRDLNMGQIDRGYERIDERLRGLGAQIERM